MFRYGIQFSRQHNKLFFLIIGVKKIWARQFLFSECKDYAKYAYDTAESPTLSIVTQYSNTLECAFEKEQLIVGGTLATREEFPHMVRIYFIRDAQNYYYYYLNYLPSAKTKKNDSNVKYLIFSAQNSKRDRKEQNVRRKVLTKN